MSGSGSGGGGGFSQEKKDCNSLTIRTQISSPQPKVVSLLNIDDILNLVLMPPVGPVQVVTQSGQVAGAVSSADLPELIQCMVNNHVFIAKVTSINGGYCQILISHK